MRSASRNDGAPERHDHELLQVHVVVRVLAAVHDVHQRHGQGARVHAAEVAVERRSRAPRAAALATAMRDAEDGVGAEAGSCWACRPGRSCARSTAELVVGVHADEARGDRLVHVAHGLRARPCRRSGPCRRRAARRPRARRSRRRRGRRRGRRRRRRAGTSTSTVGLPRESRISRAFRVVMVSMGFSQGGRDGAGQQCRARLRSASGRPSSGPLANSKSRRSLTIAEPDA